MQDKRGIAQIITTVILIGLALAAIATVWAVISNLIKNNTNEISLGKLTVSAEIEKAYINATENNVSLLVKRDVGEGDISGFKFVFTDGNQTETVDQNTNLAELGEQTFSFHLVLTNASKLITVTIAPLIQNGNSQIMGNNNKQYNINDIKAEESTAEPPSQGTGPVCGNNVIETGEVCDGTDLNGQTCITKGFTGGTLACLADCSGYDTSPCTNGISCTDLRLLMHFDASGSTTPDSSGNGNDGSVFYATWTGGKFGGVYQFNGVNSYILTNRLGGPPSTETESVWFKPIYPGGCVVDEIGQATLNTGWHDCQIEVETNGDVKGRFWQLNPITIGSISWGQWYHVALTYDGTTMKGYLDGTLSIQTTTASRATISTGNWFMALGAIDSTGLGNAVYFNGTIDDFAIWNRNLSSTEISDIYNSGSAISCG